MKSTENNKNTPLSQFFKPFIDRIREVLSNPKTKGVDKKYSEEEYNKDLDLLKSAFDKDFIDFDEYVEKKTLIKAKLDDLNKVKQNYADAIITDSLGNVLLLRRAITDTFCPDCWSLPGGKIEKDELPSDAVIREVKEETNLNIVDCNLLLEKKISSGSIFYFQCTVDDKSDIILDPNEHISFDFYSKEDWLKMNLILDLKNTLSGFDDLLVDNFDLFPLFGKDKSKYSNIIEEIANIHPEQKDIFMLKLFMNEVLSDDEYVQYIEKSQKDDTHKNKLVKLNGTEKESNKKVVKWVSKIDLKKLANHAKNSSHKDLETTIKESAHPQLREHAHAEIKRRENEEKEKEEKDGYEAHEYHGKDFKYSAKDNKHVDEEGNEANPAKLYQYYDMRHKEQDNKLKQLSVDLEGSTKQKQALGNKLKTAYYQKLNKTRFAGDEESCYKTAIEKLTKMGMTEVDIEPEKVKKIINKKLVIKNN